MRSLGGKDKRKERKEGRKEGGKEVMKEEREEDMKEGRKEGRKERSVYACSCVCYCKTKHATVGLLDLFLVFKTRIYKVDNRSFRAILSSKITLFRKIFQNNLKFGH